MSLLKRQPARPTTTTAHHWWEDPRLVAATNQLGKFENELYGGVEREKRVASRLGELEQTLATIDRETESLVMKGIITEGDISRLTTQRMVAKREFDEAKETTAHLRATRDVLSSSVEQLRKQLAREARCAAVAASRPVVDQLVPLLREVAALSKQLGEITARTEYVDALRPPALFMLDETGGGSGFLSNYLKDLETFNWDSYVEK